MSAQTDLFYIDILSERDFEYKASWDIYIAIAGGTDYRTGLQSTH